MGGDKTQLIDRHNRQNEMNLVRFYVVSLTTMTSKDSVISSWSALSLLAFPGQRVQTCCYLMDDDVFPC